MNSKTYPKPASESLKQAVREIIGGDGKAYAEIPHPDFAAWPSKRKAAKRQKLIEPHLEYRGGTALDIGTYLGAFSHWLEDLGYRVTAVERNRQCVAVARQLRDLSGKTFEIQEGSFHDLVQTKFDVVLALNVFYQSLRRPNSFAQLEEFLPRLDCHMMIFESHDPSALPPVEGRPDMSPEEFVRFIADRSGLSDVQEIGTDGPRTLYKLKRPADGRAKDATIEIKPAAPVKKAAPAAKSRPAKEAKPAKEPKPPITVAALALLLDAGVEKLVGDHIGCAVRQLDKKEHIRPKVSQGKRRYFRHRLETVEAKPRQLTVFSKSGVGAPNYLLQVESVLNDVSIEEFRAPHFYGIADLADGQREGRVGVWEFIAGETYAVQQASREILHRLVKAAAGIGTATENAKVRVPRLRDRVRFAKPLAAAVETTLGILETRGVDTSSLRPQADRFAAHEESVLARLRDIGNTTLCHMDFGNGNVVFPETGPPIVIDWESACLGPPASTLRKLAMVNADIHPELAALYAKTVQSLGGKANVADALFAMRAVQVYYSLDWGCRRDPHEGNMVEHAIRWGLTNLDFLEIP